MSRKQNRSAFGCLWLLLSIFFVVLSYLRSHDAIPSQRLRCHSRLAFFHVLGKRLLHYPSSEQNTHGVTVGFRTCMLIAISGDVETNPGPRGRPPKYPCGACMRAVRDEDSVLCDHCDQWYHKECLRMPQEVFDALTSPNISWTCCNCGMPSFSSDLFNASIRHDTSQFSVLSSPEATRTEEPLSTSSPQPTARLRRRNTHPINVLSLNCNSLKSINKQSELVSLIDQHNPQVIIGCESKLDKTFPNHEVFPSDYEIYRKDRSSSGGGVFIAIDKTLTAKHEPSLDNDSECIWISTSGSNAQKVYIGSYYRPPSDSTSLSALQESIARIHQQSGGKHPQIVIGGDFNCPNVDWAEQTVTTRDPNSQLLLDICQEYDLTQHVKEVTRHASENILDLILTSRPNMAKNVTTAPGMSDHEAVTCTLDLRPQIQNKPSRKIHLYKRGDYDSMRKDAESWAENFLNDEPGKRSVDENWALLKHKLKDLADTYVPCKYTKHKRHLPWITPTIKRQMRKRERLYTLARRKNSERHWALYRHMRNKTIQDIHKAHAEYIDTCIGGSLEEGNPKKFYSYLRMKRTENLGIPILRSDEGFHTTDQSKAEALSKQFTSVFTSDSPDEDLPPNQSTPPYPPIPPMVFTYQGVQKLLSNLKSDKAAGPDEISAKILKELASELSKPLTFLFQQSYEQGAIPKDWSSALISAIYKKGDKMSPSNYRPVSLTCILCKTMEHIMFSSIAKHLEDNNILTFRQHGFRPGFSCVTQLVTAVHDWAFTLEKKGQCDIVLLDFSKAFDLVSHRRLLLRLEQYGVTGPAANWIKAFLHARTQTVVVNGRTAEPTSVSSGVPQGTVLGPLLFLVYINNIHENIQSELRLFADDSILYRTISSDQDHDILQQDLLTLQRWANTWKMKFNVTKCAVMSCTKKKNPSIFNYHLNQETIPRAREHDYLGIRVCDDLNWNSHCNIVVNKASKSLGMLRRNLYCCSSKVKSQAYTTIVRPKMEYASEAWSPHTATYSKKLEAVQNRAARFCCGNYLRTQSVSALVERMKWDSLQTRRRIADVVLFYKIQNKVVRIPFPPAVQPTLHVATRHTHHLAKMVPQATINAYKHSFFVRTIPVWNKLPQNAVAAESTQSFSNNATVALRAAY